MFKVNNKHTKTTPQSSLSIVNFEHVIAGWVVSYQYYDMSASPNLIGVMLYVLVKLSDHMDFLKQENTISTHILQIINPVQLKLFHVGKKMPTRKIYNRFHVGKNGIRVGKMHFSKYSIKRCCKQITSIQKLVWPYKQFLNGVIMITGR